MNRTPVSSSNLASVGYHSSSLTLGIEFKNGSVYQYFDVPETVWQGLMQAGSHGRYFDIHIKYNYRYTML